jgi:hypothetical protein
MPETSLPIVAEGVPAGLCYTNMSSDIPVIASFLRAIFSGSEINTGSSTPAAEDRGKPWFRTNSDGTDDGWWTFFSGFWVQKHPCFSGMVTMYEGALADIPTLDGGEAAAVTNITGPFWEEVTEMQARSPMHPGTLPSGTVVNVGDDIGEEKHQLTISELAEHTHPFDTSDGQLVLAQVTSGKVNDINRTGSLDYAFADPVQNTGGDVAHNTIHPVRGIFFIRRTSRLYRRRVA